MSLIALAHRVLPASSGDRLAQRLRARPVRLAQDRRAPSRPHRRPFRTRRRFDLLLRPAAPTQPDPRSGRGATRPTALDRSNRVGAGVHHAAARRRRRSGCDGPLRRRLEHQPVRFCAHAEPSLCAPRADLWPSKVLSRQLTQRGYQVQTAINGLLALHALNVPPTDAEVETGAAPPSSFDAVLMDIARPHRPVNSC